jgi:phosphopantothenoylcysteine decarboxylase/phosphopantothenate--cysteine ligase
MHPRMWTHPATQRNVADLSAQGRVTLAGPVPGEVASGDAGMGRMMEPAAILAAAEALLTSSASASAVAGTRADLASVRIVVTAGPTLEDLDPVRFIGNRSSGKMGFAVAEHAAVRGADVTLIAGPVHLSTPPGVRRVDVRSALEMRGALWDALRKDLSGADALVMAAAVADHRPAQVATSKIKKSAQRGPRDPDAGEAAASIELVKNPDLLGEIGAARAEQGFSRPVLVGFAVETAGGEALVAYARRKLEEKRVDLVVANEARDSFGREDNRVVLVPGAGAEGESVPLASKSALAHVILDRIRALL